MDNASKNAGEMIGRLQMQYNRGRQANITNELVDIITGASGTLFTFIQSNCNGLTTFYLLSTINSVIILLSLERMTCMSKYSMCRRYSLCNVMSFP